MRWDIRKGLEALGETVLDTLVARFGLVPDEVIDKIRAIERLEMLKSLHREAIRCLDLDSFEKRLLGYTSHRHNLRF